MNKLFWVVTYQDGTTMAQHEAGVERSSEQIDRNGLRKFSIYNTYAEPVLDIDVKPGDTMAYRCRTLLKSNGTEPERVHVICLVRQSVQQVIFVQEKTGKAEFSEFSTETQYKHEFQMVPADLLVVT